MNTSVKWRARLALQGRGGRARIKCRHPVRCFAPYTKVSIIAHKAIQTSEGRALLPLLDPRKHSVPFAVALELHRAPSCQDAGASGGTALPPPPPASCSRAEPQLLELRFLLAGSGELVHCDGRRETLEAASSVLLTHGTGACQAAPGAEPLPAPSCERPPCRPNTTSDLVGCLDLPLGHPWSMASLVVYFPRSLLEPRQQAQQQQHEQSVRQAGMTVHPALMRVLEQECWGAGGGGAVRQAAAVSVAAAAAAAAAGQVALPPGRSQDQQGSSSQPSAAAPRREPVAGGRWLWQALLGHLASRLGGNGEAAAPAAAEDWWRMQQAAEPCIIKRVLQQLPVFQMPDQTNRLAVAFDPVDTPEAPLVFALEVFEADHRTKPHVHNLAHELFFIVSGEGEAFCEGERLPVAPGDLIVFGPGAVHGLDVLPGSRLYCLELMLPNDCFSELVRSGRELEGLQAEDLRVIAPACCST